MSKHLKRRLRWARARRRRREKSTRRTGAGGWLDQPRCAGQRRLALRCGDLGLPCALELSMGMVSTR